MTKRSNFVAVGILVLSLSSFLGAIPTTTASAFPTTSSIAKRVFLLSSSEYTYPAFEALMSLLREKGYSAAFGPTCDLTSTDVLVVIWGRDLDQFKTDDLLAFVKQGGGLFIIASDSEDNRDVNPVNRIAIQFGIKYVYKYGEHIPGYSGNIAVIKDPEHEEKRGIIISDFEKHAITDGIRSALMVDFYGGRGAPVMTYTGQGTVVARFSEYAYSTDGTYFSGDKPPAAVAIKYSQGRVFALASDCAYSGESFGDHLYFGDTMKLWVNAIDWLLQETEAPRRFSLSIVTEPPNIKLVPGEGEYSEGAIATLEAETVYSGNVRYVFEKWVINNSSQSENPITIGMNSDTQVTLKYKTQFRLAVNTEFGTPRGEGWYDAGSTAAFSISLPFEIGIQHTFAGWSGDSSATTQAATIVMDAPHTVIADWTTDYSQLYIIGVVATLIIIGVAIVFVRHKKRR